MQLSASDHDNLRTEHLESYACATGTQPTFPTMKILWLVQVPEFLKFLKQIMHD
jgi:hypothetical protein